jgi:hypothetical protein
MTLSMMDRYDTSAGVDTELVTESVAGDGPRLPLAVPVLDEQAAREAARRAVADGQAGLGRGAGAGQG